MTEQTSAEPRHLIIAQVLQDRIGAGQVPPGGRFPTEKELQEEFGIGRHSIREALKILTERGLIARRRKTGTVVLAHTPVAPVAHSLRDIRSLLEFAISTRLDIRHSGFIRLTGTEATGFADLPDCCWLRLAGMRSTLDENRPLCWSEIFIPEGLASVRDDRADFTAMQGQPIYEAVLALHGLKLDHVEQVIEATLLTAPAAALFGVAPGSAALMIKRRYVALPDLTFEISHNLYPASHYAVRTVLRQRV